MVEREWQNLGYSSKRDPQIRRVSPQPPAPVPQESNPLDVIASTKDEQPVQQQESSPLDVIYSNRQTYYAQPQTEEVYTDADGRKYRKTGKGYYDYYTGDLVWVETSRGLMLSSELKQGVFWSGDTPYLSSDITTQTIYTIGGKKYTLRKDREYVNADPNDENYGKVEYIKTKTGVYSKEDLSQPGGIVTSTKFSPTGEMTTVGTVGTQPTKVLKTVTQPTGEFTQDVYEVPKPFDMGNGLSAVIYPIGKSTKTVEEQKADAAEFFSKNQLVLSPLETAIQGHPLSEEEAHTRFTFLTQPLYEYSESGQKWYSGKVEGVRDFADLAETTALPGSSQKYGASVLHGIVDIPSGVIGLLGIPRIAEVNIAGAKKYPDEYLGLAALSGVVAYEGIKSDPLRFATQLVGSYYVFKGVSYGLGKTGGYVKATVADSGVVSGIKSYTGPSLESFKSSVIDIHAKNFGKITGGEVSISPGGVKEYNFPTKMDYNYATGKWGYAPDQSIGKLDWFLRVDATKPYNPPGAKIFSEYVKPQQFDFSSYIPKSEKIGSYYRSQIVAQYQDMVSGTLEYGTPYTTKSFDVISRQYKFLEEHPGAIRSGTSYAVEQNAPRVIQSGIERVKITNALHDIQVKQAVSGFEEVRPPEIPLSIWGEAQRVVETNLYGERVGNVGKAPSKYDLIIQGKKSQFYEQQRWLSDQVDYDFGGKNQPLKWSAVEREVGVRTPEQIQAGLDVYYRYSDYMMTPERNPYLKPFDASKTRIIGGKLYNKVESPPITPLSKTFGVDVTKPKIGEITGVKTPTASPVVGIKSTTTSTPDIYSSSSPPPSQILYSGVKPDIVWGESVFEKIVQPSARRRGVFWFEEETIQPLAFNRFKGALVGSGIALEMVFGSQKYTVEPTIKSSQITGTVPTTTEFIQNINIKSIIGTRQDIFSGQTSDQRITPIVIPGLVSSVITGSVQDIITTQIPVTTQVPGITQTTIPKQDWSFLGEPAYPPSKPGQGSSPFALPGFGFPGAGGRGRSSRKSRYKKFTETVPVWGFVEVTLGTKAQKDVNRIARKISKSLDFGLPVKKKTTKRKTKRVKRK